MKYNILTVFLFGAFLLSCENDNMSTGGTGKGGSMARFTIANNYLYTVSDMDLNVFDLSTVEDPVQVNTVHLGYDVETIFPYDNHIFIGTQTGMQILDITTPDEPEYVSEYSHIYSCDPVVVSGNYAYVTLNTNNIWCGRDVNRLEIIDISDIFNPRQISQVNMDGPLGLGVDGNLLFVCDNELKILDITDKMNVKILHAFPVKAYDVIPYHDILIVTGSEGISQYRYLGEEITLLSKLSVERK